MHRTDDERCPSMTISRKRYLLLSPMMSFSVNFRTRSQYRSPTTHAVLHHPLHNFPFNLDVRRIPHLLLRFLAGIHCEKCLLAKSLRHHLTRSRKTNIVLPGLQVSGYGILAERPKTEEEVLAQRYRRTSRSAWVSLDN